MKKIIKFCLIAMLYRNQKKSLQKKRIETKIYITTTGRLNEKLKYISKKAEKEYKLWLDQSIPINFDETNKPGPGHPYHAIDMRIGLREKTYWYEWVHGAYSKV